MRLRPLWGTRGVTARVRAVVPMKPLATSKSRVATSLPPGRRALLSLAMLAAVLDAARSAVVLDETVVVGGDAAVERLSGALGATWRPETAAGLNESLAQELRDTMDSAWAATLYLPADLPLVTSADIERFVATADSPTGLALTIAPDRWERGTNALLVPAGLELEPALGQDSFRVHVERARGLGSEPRVYRSEALLLDVDTAEDLALLLARRPDWWEEAEGIVSALDLPDDVRRAILLPSQP